MSPELDYVDRSLNFEHDNHQITGGCEIFTFKSSRHNGLKFERSTKEQLDNAYEKFLKAYEEFPEEQRRGFILEHERWSPFGSFKHSANQDIYTYVLAALNIAHADYNFALRLNPKDFKRESNFAMIRQTIDDELSRLRRVQSTSLRRSDPIKTSKGVKTVHLTSDGEPIWTFRMWEIIDSIMDLSGCGKWLLPLQDQYKSKLTEPLELYSYDPPASSNPLRQEERPLHLYQYFYVNRNLRRVCYLHVHVFFQLGMSSQSSSLYASGTRPTLPAITIAEDDAADILATETARPVTKLRSRSKQDKKRKDKDGKPMNGNGPLEDAPKEDQSRESRFKAREIASDQMAQLDGQDESSRVVRLKVGKRGRDAQDTGLGVATDDSEPASKRRSVEPSATRLEG